MKIIKEYTQWLNENYQAINEAGGVIYKGVPIKYVLTDFDVKDPNFITKYNSFLVSKPAGTQFKLFTDEVVKSGGMTIRQPADQQQIFLALAAHGQFSKAGFFKSLFSKSLDTVINGTMDSLIAGTSTITYTRGTADYVPSGSDSMYTKGHIYKLGPDGGIVDVARLNATTLYNVVGYVNVYNANAFATGQGQFILSQRLDAATGFMDLLSPPAEVGEILYQYCSKVNVQQVASKDTKTNTGSTGGTDAIDAKFKAEFDRDSYVINTAVQAEVDRAVILCLAQFPNEKRPSTFTITSGSSTEYGYDAAKKSILMPRSSGTGPVTGTTPEAKNQALAYNRGLAFMTALNAGLKAKGHLGFPTAVIKWTIGQSGPAAKDADRFVDLNITDNAKQPIAPLPTNTTTGALAGPATATVKDKAQLYELQLSFTAAQPAAK